jgi:hypothetical protein
LPHFSLLLGEVACNHAISGITSQPNLKRNQLSLNLEISMLGVMVERSIHCWN